MLQSIFRRENKWESIFSLFPEHIFVCYSNQIENKYEADKRLGLVITLTSISTKQYIEQWQDALSQEIGHLKKYGSHKYVLMNGNQIESGETYTYYFETVSPLKIPVGTVARLERDGSKYDARVLSAEGNTLLVSLEQSIGDLIDEAFISHDPWELLEQLIERLDEIKKSKRKRSRVKRLMAPDFPDKRPSIDSKTAVQELFQRSKYNPVTFVWGPPGKGKKPTRSSRKKKTTTSTKTIPMSITARGWSTVTVPVCSC